MECLQSGMTKTEWCRAKGIRPRMFYYWQKVIREEELALIGEDNLVELLSTSQSDNGNPENDFFEVPSHISEAVVDVPSLPDHNSRLQNRISFSYRGCDLSIDTDDVGNVVSSIIKALDHA